MPLDYEKLLRALIIYREIRDAGPQYVKARLEMVGSDLVTEREFEALLRFERVTLAGLSAADVLRSAERNGGDEWLKKRIANGVI